MEQHGDLPIACDLSALALEEQARRGDLMERILGNAATNSTTRERYTMVIEAPSSLAGDVVEWFLLEKRCCPFLRLGLGLEPGDERPRITLCGGPGVKQFLASSGMAKLAEGSQ